MAFASASQHADWPGDPDLNFKVKHINPVAARDPCKRRGKYLETTSEEGDAYRPINKSVLPSDIENEVLFSFAGFRFQVEIRQCFRRNWIF